MNYLIPKSRGTLIVLGMVGLLGLVSPVKASEASGHQKYLNGGYYLLYHLCDDEKSLPLLLDIKTAPAEIETYAKHVSITAKESITALEHMQENDSRLNFDVNPLPEIERDVRDSVKDDKQHQLVFGTSGPEFVRALLVSQIEASNYALNLAKVLSGQEKNPARVKALQRISAHWRVINQEAYRLLRN